MGFWTGSGVDSQEFEIVFTCDKCGKESHSIAYETRWRDKAFAECEHCDNEIEISPSCE